jgi:cob(I)alamin adenosyltransferase
VPNDFQAELFRRLDAIDNRIHSIGSDVATIMERSRVSAARLDLQEKELSALKSNINRWKGALVVITAVASVAGSSFGTIVGLFKSASGVH